MREVVVRSLSIADTEGRVRIRLSCDDHGFPSVVLVGATGTDRVALRLGPGVDGEVASISLRDNEGKEAAGYRVDARGRDLLA